MTAPKPAHVKQAKMLAEGLAADVVKGMDEAALKRRQIAGTTGEASLEQMAREAGLRAVDIGDGAVLIIAGRGYK